MAECGGGREAGTTPEAEAGDAQPLWQTAGGREQACCPCWLLGGVDAFWWRQWGGWAPCPAPGGTLRGSTAPMAGNAIAVGKAARAVGVLLLPAGGCGLA